MLSCAFFGITRQHIVIERLFPLVFSREHTSASKVTSLRNSKISSADLEMNFDGFLSTVNGWGRYQKTKFLLVCLTYMVPPIMVYTWSFTAATPDFRCRHPEQTSDAYIDLLNDRFNQLYQPTQDQCAREQTRLSLKECQRCYRQSLFNRSSTSLDLQPCQTYVFDRSIYERTLVEEVSASSFLLDERSPLADF